MKKLIKSLHALAEALYKNNPPDLIPQEDWIVNHLRYVLTPYSTTTGVACTWMLSLLIPITGILIHSQ
ncbi:hypothetical protein Tsubulata_021439 [Turnera subulata]|uniref:Uncharacterized protein n=1 Tax=Turnera subulata TaxID=218843 RepID=A0A9Q0F4M4_9ROSI|nr:hypothetical protein Tsubulata_021439 [Turnera subulata]